MLIRFIHRSGGFGAYSVGVSAGNAQAKATDTASANKLYMMKNLAKYMVYLVLHSTMSAIKMVAYSIHPDSSLESPSS